MGITTSMMKNILAPLRTAPRLMWLDIALTIIPALAWYAGVLGRETIITPRCATDVALCARETVHGIDRRVIGMNSGRADGLSFVTQNWSGYLALTVPGIWVGALAIAGKLTPMGALAAVGTDLVIMAQTVSWNGALNEGARLIVQRPRPFVYANPSALGANPHNYTSFYSGHTSFTAAATVSLLLTLAGRAAPGIILWLAGILAAAMIPLTGLFRVLSGRHFISDVCIAATAGTLIALVIALLHKRRNRNSV